MGMPTNVRVGDALLAEAVKRGGGKSKRATVNEALAEFVRKRRAEGIIALFGTIDYDPSYDHKEERRRSTRKALRKVNG